MIPVAVGPRAIYEKCRQFARRDPRVTEFYSGLVIAERIFGRRRREMRPLTGHVGAVVCLALAATAACTEDYAAAFKQRPGSTSGADANLEGADGGGGSAAPENRDFASSSSCKTCHATIYEQWSTSMHARASTSITTVVQTNLVAKAKLFEGPRATFCVSCHAPVQATIAKDGTLPVAGAAAAGLDDGVSCGGCHQFGSSPAPGSGGVLADYSLALTRGPTYYGPIADPYENGSPHASEYRATFGDQGGLCANCHDVNLDLDGDARIHPVQDLVLQTTHSEYDAYRQTLQGAKTCAECHMPALSRRRAADGVAGAPDRVVHDHRFVGVDKPLDGSADEQAAARKALLAGAASLDLNLSGNLVTVTIANTGAGHSLPTGFAFARQMWIELIVRDDVGAILFSSGALRDARADLCDRETLASQLRLHVDGCLDVDAQLASFQQKLVDKIVPKIADGVQQRNALGELIPAASDSADEVFLQHPTGGAVSRARAGESNGLAPLAPGAKRSVTYTLPVETLDAQRLVTARLLFRALPPYFVRALMNGHPSRETALSGLEVIEMARADVKL
jgi:hypothetical protein